MVQIDYDLVLAMDASLQEALESVRKAVGEHQTNGWQAHGSLVIDHAEQAGSTVAPFLYCVVQPMVKFAS